MLSTTTVVNTTNRSNQVLTSSDIEKYIELYENPDAWAEYFLERVAKAGLSDSVKEDIRKNFPYADHFRRTVKRLAMSIPSFSWELSKEATNRLAGSEPEANAIKDDSIEDGDVVKEPTILDKALELSSKRFWEGDKDIYGALNSWREFSFVTGDTFITLDKVDNSVRPERKSSQDSEIKLSEKYKKQIEGYEFEYEVGDGDFSTEGSPVQTIKQTYTTDKWVQKGVDGDPVETTLNFGFTPVSHMAWEEREGSPRGLPLAERLIEIVLHIYAVGVGRRSGNKLNSFPIGVLRNGTSKVLNYFAGMVMSITDKGPTMPASFDLKGGGLNLTATENEYEDAKRELSEAAFLPFEGKEGAQGIEPASGVSLEKLTAGQTAYRVQYMIAEASFLEDLIYKALNVDGTKVGRGDIVVKYDGFGENQSQKREDAKVLFAEQFTKEGLRVMGYEENAVTKLMREKGEKKVDDFNNIFGGDGLNDGGTNDEGNGEDNGEEDE